IRRFSGRFHHCDALTYPPPSRQTGQIMSEPQDATPRSFTVADLTANGELRSRSAYDYPRLEQIPGAADFIGRFSSLLWRSPDEFDLNLEGSAELRFRWKASADTAGIATLWCGKNLVSISLLATGLNPEADAITLQAFQQHLVRLLHDTGYEPSFALIDLL